MVLALHNAAADALTTVVCYVVVKSVICTLAIGHVVDGNKNMEDIILAI